MITKKEIEEIAFEIGSVLNNCDDKNKDDTLRELISSLSSYFKRNNQKEFNKTTFSLYASSALWKTDPQRLVLDAWKKGFIDKKQKPNIKE
ncbi:MAG: hypothetical protein PHN69_06850 [Candidatus Pacebacteria bacterium]|nr:hypothetical protein [Candidatus Paceibacterota bacterium]